MLENRRKETSDNDIDSLFDCPICSESYTLSSDIVAACNSSVKHYFYHGCLLNWFSETDRCAKYRRHCPVCREEVFSNERAYVATPFRHGTSNQSEVLWWMHLYRATGVLINDEPPFSSMPVTEVGAWSVAQSSADKADVLLQGPVTMTRYDLNAMVEEEPSWMAIYERYARIKEGLYNSGRLYNSGIPYVSPGQPPTWIPITELGAWMLACTDEQREVVLRRAQIIKAAYKRISEGV